MSKHLLKNYGHLARQPGTYPTTRHLVNEFGCIYCASGFSDTWTMLTSGVVVPTSCCCDASRCGKWTSTPSVGPNTSFTLTRTESNPCRWEYNATGVTGQCKVYDKTGGTECQADDLQYTWNVKSIHVWLDVDGFSLECGIYYLADRPGQTDNKLLLVFDGEDFANECDAAMVSNQFSTCRMGAVAGYDEVGYDGNATCTPNYDA